MKSRTYIQLLVGVVLCCVWCAIASPSLHAMPLLIIQQQTAPQDTVPQDTIPPYEPTKTPTYQPSYRFGDPFSNRSSPSPLQLSDPSSVDLQVEFDSSVNYNVYERIGDVNFRPVTTMSFEEYDAYNDQAITKEYFKERSSGLDGESAVSGRSLIPRLYISPIFDRLFGGSYVDIQPNGFVNLDFGGRFQRVDNPAIPIRQQRNGGFNFDQQISLNLVGKIGEKLAVTANFDNNNTFDFQNNLKVEYTGYEEDIVKKIEIGNVSMPVTNSLMTGAQSLFGVKTQLQFGKLFLTGVMSRQQGKSDVITIESGFQGKEFEVRASNYDENRHFFLSHFFRNNYEGWLQNLPQVTSGVNITRVEAYVINRNNDTRTTREVLGLMDLGEGNRIYRKGNPYVGSGKGRVPTDNSANELFASLKSDGRLRQNDQVTNILEQEWGFVNSTDFVKKGTARRLEDDEFVYHDRLGYITLLRKLQNDEMLAVAYEYSYNGQVYTVGELSEEYSALSDDQVVFLKLLRPDKINTMVPTWDLMMKNIYNLNASQIERDGFTLRIHYRDDATGIDNPSLHEGRQTKDKPLIELLGLDQLNQNNDKQRDGNFDFIEGLTIDKRNGNVIFPVLEPFGSTLESYFEPGEVALKEKYVYDTLYRTTRADAEQVASKNKFFILGKFNSGSSSEIALPGINIAENSVVVTAGNTPLTEGLDYTVDYNLGRVRILNDGILSSGKTINIAYEKADLFNFQSRWLYGVRADYQFSERFNIGATLLHLNEQPGGVSRFAIGDEPTKNTKYGFDINFQDEVPFLTKAMDFLPLVSTKAPSSITFNAEFAQMRPGTSNLVDGKGTSYIDDFESAVTPINLMGWAGWKLGATPETVNDQYGAKETGRRSNYNKAKIAWYSVDISVFYRSGGSRRPENISEDELENNYVRPVMPQEIFRQRDNNQIVTPENIFDIAYFPRERGQYNFNPDLEYDPTLTDEGLLKNPRANFGAISRAITNEVDFDKTNVEYLEFWMMDPFTDVVNDGIFNEQNTTGGELIFNLGSISEDVIPDGRHAFESGLPADGDTTQVIPNEWGRVPSEPFLTNYFENSAAARANQDVGLEGLTDEDERSYFQDFLNQIPQSARAAMEQDPSADNFRYFLGSDYDAQDAGILERYKNFNGLDGNSPVNSGNSIIQASTTTPDNEDLNQDNTISDLEEYYEYKLDLRPDKLVVGENHIVDIQEGINGANWYLFRIPIRNPDRVYGGISGFKTIRYLRMYLTDFSQPVVLRMGKFQLVGSQWRKYQEALNSPGLNEIPETSYSDFNVSVVNVEENSTGDYPYVVPPGINRDRDNTTIVNRRVNEQSLQICVADLEENDARAVFKNVTIDLINYGRLQMFLHAQAHNYKALADDEVYGFVRFGTDHTENYYEIEVPLKVTPPGANGASEVWPELNEIDVSINELLGIKSERNRANFNERIPYTTMSNDRRYRFTVKGRPDISSVQVLMIGVRNPESEDRSPKSVCLWANELRVTDFDSNKGWAANARLSTKLADVATINASTRYTSIGFGNLQQTIQQRTRYEMTQYDLSANVNVDKFLLPEKTGLKVPMFVSLERSRKIPQFDPLDPDIPLEASLEAFDSPEERDQYRRIVEERSERRSINFTNVRKEKVNQDANRHFFDIENLSFSYAYSDVTTSNVNTETYLQKSVSAGVGYNYSPQPLVIEPFAKGELFSSPYLKLIKDLNLSLLPNSVSVRGDLNRNFRMTRLYDDELNPMYGDEYYERLFTFNRNYSLRWNLFKSLNLDYSARANAVIDEIEDSTPIEGDIDSQEERQYIWEEIKSLGRMKNFTQDISATYKTPLDKLPLTDWLSADLKYAVGYNWTAGSLDQNDTLGFFFGHTIENRRDRGVSGKVDLVKLYNKIDFLKQINTPQRRRQRNDDEESESSNFNPGKIFLRTLMAVRNINMTYNIRESTSLSGFMNEPFLMGMDSSWNSPGWGFLLGQQDPDIRFKAARNGWLTKSQQLTTPFVQTYSEDLGIRASIEPAKDFKIQLDASRTNNATFQEIFRYDENEPDNNGYRSLTPARKGSYNISFMSIKTAFDEKGANNTSETFDAFRQNVETIRQRQNRINGENGFYDSLSQDVLVPAFISAYSGSDAGSIDLNPFPKIPLPGWRVDYNGLSKIPLFAELFSSITLSHGYRSMYSINDYNFNISQYGDQLGQDLSVTLDNSILDYPQATQTNDSGRFVPVYILNQVTISEQFMPLIGVNFRTKKDISTRLEYKKERTLSLNVSNSQITETTSNDVTLDFGYTNDEFKLPFKIQGRTITLDNAVTMRVSLTIRDSETIQRKLEGESKVTNGNTNFQFRPSFTYKINDQLDLSFYFERSVNEPKISSFKTATTAIGTQLRFSLTQ